MKDTASKICAEKEVQNAPVRVYMDGGFDLLHSGHYNAIR